MKSENNLYPNKARSHLVTIVPKAPFTLKSTAKLRSALHFQYSIAIPSFYPSLNTVQSYNSNNHYK